MTVITNQAADRFVLKPPPDLRFYLVHGPDEGLVHERTKTIVESLVGRSRGSLRVDRLDGDAVARAPGSFRDEACALSLFGEARLFWLDAQGRDLLSALEPLFGLLPERSVIVVRAGALKKGHALRSAFESRPDSVAVECYPDSPDMLRALIDSEARDAGFAITSDARDTLVALLGGDRQATRNELTKLVSFAAGRPAIDIDDVHAIVSDAAPSNLDDVVNAVLSGDRAAALAAVTRFFREDGDIERLWVFLSARLSLLYRLRLEIDKGTPFDVALRSVGARVPYGSRPALAAQARRRGAYDVLSEIGALRTAAAKIRLSPRMAPLLASRMLLALVSRSRRAER